MDNKDKKVFNAHLKLTDKLKHTEIDNLLDNWFTNLLQSQKVECYLLLRKYILERDDTLEDILNIK
jgi:hypothetical protein